MSLSLPCFSHAEAITEVDDIGNQSEFGVGEIICLDCLCNVSLPYNISEVSMIISPALLIRLD